MIYINILIVIVLLWHSCFSQIKQNNSDIYSRLQQVETGLCYAIQIDGELFPTFTISERMKYHNVPAVSIALINDGEIEWTKAYGYLSMDMMERADTLTLFQAASISKAVSAIAALQLVEQGKIDLDENINTYLTSWKVKNSSFTEKEAVTLRRLLTHTAGLTVHGFLGYAQEEALPTLVQILNGEKPANSLAVMTDVVPGSLWRYSGGGYVLMQQLVEDIVGYDFATLMQQSVLSPIGMKHSTFQQILPSAWQKQVSVGHQPDGKKIPGNWHIYPESAAAGLWTTPSDLAQYIIEIQKSLKGKSNKVLSEQMIKQMLTKHLGDWGLGPVVYGDNDSLAFGHSGSNEGYRCFSFGSAYSGKGAVIMTNSDNGTDLINEIARSMAITYNWDYYKPQTKTYITLIPSQLATFVGKYFLEQFNVTLVITVQNNFLLLKQLWNDQRFILYPESDLDFFMKEKTDSIKFEPSTDGTIIGLKLLGLKWIKVKS